MLIRPVSGPLYLDYYVFKGDAAKVQSLAAVELKREGYEIDPGYGPVTVLEQNQTLGRHVVIASGASLAGAQLPPDGFPMGEQRVRVKAAPGDVVVIVSRFEPNFVERFTSKYHR